MALNKKQITEIREALEFSKKPLIFFHDDADGLCSFILLYRFVNEGKGIIVKTTPKIDEKFLPKVVEYSPDKIFIVDTALVDQDFIDKAKTEIIWIDHHDPLKRYNVKYYNPRESNYSDNIPVSALCYDVVQEDMWISMLGSIGDWYWPSFAEEFKKEYPDLLPEDVKDPETALFETKLGELIKIVSFILKGKTSEVMKCVKILTRIKSPYEILNGTTPAGKYILKEYRSANKEYEKLLKKSLEQKPDGKLLIFRYLHGKISFTKDIANELLHRHPDKIIIIAREKSDEMKMSIRSKKTILPPIIQKALSGVEGFGGGHEYACGANVKKKDCEKFIEQFKSLI